MVSRELRVVFDKLKRPARVCDEIIEELFSCLDVQ